MQLIIGWYFSVLDQFGLVGVVLLMAMESSIFPVPSELVVPPAAYLRSHEQDAPGLRLLEVIAAGTIGSYLGSASTYWLARLAGRPFILKYGRYLFASEDKVRQAENWLLRHGAMGVFLSRLLPGIRHINAIPAGLVGLRFSTFSIMTLAGSAVWCSILALLGRTLGPDMEIVIASQGQTESAGYQHAMASLTLVSVSVAAGVGLLYLLAIWWQQRVSQSLTHERGQTKLL